LSIRAISAARRRFSLRSSSLKPRSLLRPRRIAWPSSNTTAAPSSKSFRSSSCAARVFPLWGGPKNSTVRVGIVAAGVVPNRIVGPRNATAPYRTGNLPSYALDVVAQYVTSPTAVLGVSPAVGIRGSVAESGGETLDPAFILPEV